MNKNHNLKSSLKTLDSSCGFVDHFWSFLIIFPWFSFIFQPEWPFPGNFGCHKIHFRVASRSEPASRTASTMVRSNDLQRVMGNSPPVFCWGLDMGFIHWPSQEPIDWRYRFHICLGLNFSEYFPAKYGQTYGTFTGTSISGSWVIPIDL